MGCPGRARSLCPGELLWQGYHHEVIPCMLGAGILESPAGSHPIGGQSRDYYGMTSEGPLPLSVPLALGVKRVSQPEHLQEADSAFAQRAGNPGFLGSRTSQGWLATLPILTILPPLQVSEICSLPPLSSLFLGHFLWCLIPRSPLPLKILLSFYSLGSGYQITCNICLGLTFWHAGVAGGSDQTSSPPHWVVSP